MEEETVLAEKRKKEIMGIILIMLGILLALTLIFHDQGRFMIYIKQLLSTLLGQGVMGVPLFFILWGLVLIREQKVDLNTRLLGLTIMICSLLTLLHLPVSPGEEFYHAWETRGGGGLLGALFTVLLRYGFSDTGIIVLVVGIFLIGTLLFTNLLLSCVLERLKLGFQKIKELGFLHWLHRREKKEKEEDEDLQEETSAADALPSPKKRDRDKGKEPREDEEPLRQGGNYRFPPMNLLKSGTQRKNIKTRDLSDHLEDTLASFGVTATVQRITHGPTISRYELQPARGIKVNKIMNLSNDIALAFAVPDVRIEAPIPGKSLIGIEVPHSDEYLVTLKDILNTAGFRKSKDPLLIGLGLDISGEPVFASLGKMPHLLIAGATGSGKSVCMNSIISSILYNASPEEVKLILIDPKKVELNRYQGLPHLMAPVVVDLKQASAILAFAVETMEERYERFARVGARDISSYNHISSMDEEEEFMPYVVIVVDELADMMMVAPEVVENSICRLAQMARAAGIHLVIATQRPSVDVITGLIKANIPSRIAFAVSSQVDSRTILDMGGAEKLLGKGDMLYYPVGGNKPLRVQGAFITEKEIDHVVQFICRDQDVQYLIDLDELNDESDELDLDDRERDSLYEKAVFIVVENQASISMLQRRLRIGYSRAARLIDTMEQDGIVGPYIGSKPRKILVDLEDVENRFAKREKNGESNEN